MLGCNYAFFAKGMYYADFRERATREIIDLNNQLQFHKMSVSGVHSSEKIVDRDNLPDFNKNYERKPDGKLENSEIDRGSENLEKNEQEILEHNQDKIKKQGQNLNKIPEKIKEIHLESKHQENTNINYAYQGDCNRPPPQHEINSDSTSIGQTGERFKKRRTRLSEACEKLNIHPQCDGHGYWPLATNAIVIDSPNHLLGCLVQKSASSSWHKVFWELYTARQKSKNPNGNFTFISGKAYTNNYYRSSVARVGAGNWLRALNEPNFVRFLTARHPLARLYSGWNQNLRIGGPMSRELFRSMRLYAFKSEESNDHMLTWPDFVEFFSKTCLSQPERINVHFRPISSKCGLCKRQYDYIIKAESIEDDSRYMLELIHSKKFAENPEKLTMPDTISKLEHRNKANNSLSENPDNIGVPFQQFGDDVLNPIFEYYKLDFELLGYTYDRNTGSVGPVL